MSFKKTKIGKGLIQMVRMESPSGLSLYLIEMPLNIFASRADPDQIRQQLPDRGILCLLMEILLDMTLN